MAKSTKSRLIAMALTAGEGHPELRTLMETDVKITDTVDGAETKRFLKLADNAQRWNDELNDRYDTLRNLAYNAIGIPPLACEIDFTTVTSVIDMVPVDDEPLNPSLFMGKLLANYCIEQVLRIQVAVLTDEEPAPGLLRAFV